MILPNTKNEILGRALISSETHPVILNLILTKFFKLDWLGWLPDTLFFELERIFKFKLSEISKNKIMVLQVLQVNDVVWDHWDIFERAILTLNNLIPDLKVSQPPTLPMLMSGVNILNTVRKVEFSEEVSRYTAAVCMFHNVSYVPPPLNYCQKYLSQPMYYCKTCKKEGSALPPFDGVCDSCSHKFSHDKPFAFRIDDFAAKHKWGEDVEYYLVHDPMPTKKRFEELNALSDKELSIAIKEIPEDIESARLIIAVDYMNAKADQLNNQATKLKDWILQ